MYKEQLFDNSRIVKREATIMRDIDVCVNDHTPVMFKCSGALFADGAKHLCMLYTLRTPPGRVVRLVSRGNEFRCCINCSRFLDAHMLLCT